jgi:hypothetical protein
MPAPKQPIRIRSIAFDEKNGNLSVWFTNDHTAQYSGVTQKDYDALMEADADPKVSTWAAFQKFIKSRYKASKK